MAQLLAEQPLPPGTRWLRKIGAGFLQPLRDCRRHSRLSGIEAQQVFGSRKLADSVLRRFLFGDVFLLVLRVKLILMLHNSPYSVFLKMAAKALRARCNFPRTASADCSVSVPTSS